VLLLTCDTTEDANKPLDDVLVRSAKQGVTVDVGTCPKWEGNTEGDFDKSADSGWGQRGLPRAGPGLLLRTRLLRPQAAAAAAQEVPGAVLELQPHCQPGRPLPCTQAPGARCPMPCADPSPPTPPSTGTYTLTVDNALDLPAIVAKGSPYPATISIYGPNNELVDTLSNTDASVTASIRCAAAP
jgi:hypothetical protein